MATSSHPSMRSLDARTQVVAHASLKMAQVGAMVAPPVYLVSSLVLRRGSGFSIRRLMRWSTLGTVGGAGVGVAMGAVMMRNEAQEALEDRVYRLAHNEGQIETDDYSVIGASLAALITPTLFLKRAPFVSLVLGGACIGLGAGTWFHIGKMVAQGKDTKPEGMVGEIPVVGGNK